MKTYYAAAALGLTTLGLIGCGPSLKAQPDVVDFGDTFIGQSSTRSVYWVNSRRTAEIDEVILSRSDAFDLDASAIPEDHEIDKGERSHEVDVTFNPEKAGVYTARLMATADGGSVEPVELRGRGVYNRSTPGLELSGDGLTADRPLDHGSVPVNGAESTRRIRIQNETGRTILVKPSWGRGGQGFTLRNDVDVIELGRNEEAEVVTEFDPKTSGTFTDVLMLTIDDTDRTSGVVVTGKGTR